MSRSKNKEWKDSGSKMSFKEWLRQDLNNSVHETVEKISNNGGYSNICGSTNDAANNYKPDITHKTVLGINKYLIYGTALAISVGIVYVIIRKKK